MNFRIDVIRAMLAALLFLTATAGSARMPLALKSNVLYDAALSPNLGVELGVGPKWTVELSGNYNNWSVNGHLWKHWFVQPEGRYWLCDSFNGHFFAAHAIAGEYNFGNMHNSFKMLGSDFSGLSDRRYQGWAAGMGIGYGYTWMFSRHWSAEAEIAIGWIYTRYDVYPCTNCGSKLESGRVHNYVGPTKAALNLIYVF